MRGRQGSDGTALAIPKHMKNKFSFLAIVLVFGWTTQAQNSEFAEPVNKSNEVYQVAKHAQWQFRAAAIQFIKLTCVPTIPGGSVSSITAGKLLDCVGSLDLEKIKQEFASLNSCVALDDEDIVNVKCARARGVSCSQKFHRIAKAYHQKRLEIIDTPGSYYFEGKGAHAKVGLVTEDLHATTFKVNGDSVIFARDCSTSPCKLEEINSPVVIVQEVNKETQETRVKTVRANAVRMRAEQFDNLRHLCHPQFRNSVNLSPKCRQAVDERVCFR